MQILLDTHVLAWTLTVQAIQHGYHLVSADPVFSQLPGLPLLPN